MEHERQALAATSAPYAAELCNSSHSVTGRDGGIKGRRGSVVGCGIDSYTA
jgi:hypothetical protein